MVERSGLMMRRLLVSITAVVSMGAAGLLGGGVGSADDTHTGGTADPDAQGPVGTPGKGYQVGGAHVAGIPYEQYVRATGAKWFPNADMQIVDYPAGQVQGHTLERLFPGIGRAGEQAYPGIGLDGPSFGESVDVGRENLLAAIRAGGRGSVIGGSEGALVLDAVQARLAVDPNAPAPDQLSFALFGSPIARHAFGESFITQAFPENEMMASLDYVVPPKVDSQYDTYQFVTAYDAIADFPDRPDNLMTIANAIVGLATGHTAVSFTDPNMVPEKNIAMTVNSRGGKEFTYMVPEQHLPLTFPFKLMGVPEETLKRLDAVMKPSVDAGYSRNDNPLTAPITVDPRGFDPIKITEEAGGESFGLLPAAP